MHRLSRAASCVAFTMLIALGISAYGEATPKPFTKEALHHVKARVMSIDKSARNITLRTSPNDIVTISAGKKVRNFDKINVGDTVEVTYYEGFAAEMRKAGAPASEPAQVALGYRAPAGSQPAAGAAHAITTTVKIESVDTKAHKVSFKHGEELIKLDVKSPEGRTFIASLKPGDEVELTYIQALAIEVVPAS